MRAKTFELCERLGKSLLSMGSTITTAESCTGGGLASSITAIPGSSAWFELGFITYSNSSKKKILGIEPALIDSHGAVSIEVVEAMASKSLAIANADYSIAISGIAGPSGGTIDKPVGTVCVAWAFHSNISSQIFKFAGNRDQVRSQAVEISLIQMLKYIN